MSVEQFDAGYWYAADLKAFARKLGVPGTARLRKDQLERAIRACLGGRAPARVKTPVSDRRGPRDCDSKLSLRKRVVHYTSNKQTKDFIVAEARKLVPGLKERFGVRYRLNRWREEQLAAGQPITYGDLVREYVRLNQSTEPFERIATGRYINFLADFLAHESGATHARARRAWHELKGLSIPKHYDAWVQWRRSRSNRT